MGEFEEDDFYKSMLTSDDYDKLLLNIRNKTDNIDVDEHYQEINLVNY